MSFKTNEKFFFNFTLKINIYSNIIYVFDTCGYVILVENNQVFIINKN